MPTPKRSGSCGPEEFDSIQEDRDSQQNQGPSMTQRKEYKEMQIIKLKKYQNVDVEDVKIALDLYLHGKNRQQVNVVKSIHSEPRTPNH